MFACVCEILLHFFLFSLFASPISISFHFRKRYPYNMYATIQLNWSKKWLKVVKFLPHYLLRRSFTMKLKMCVGTGKTSKRANDRLKLWNTLTRMFKRNEFNAFKLLGVNLTAVDCILALKHCGYLLLIRHNRLIFAHF